MSVLPTSLRSRQPNSVKESLWFSQWSSAIELGDDRGRGLEEGLAGGSSKPKIRSDKLSKGPPTCAVCVHEARSCVELAAKDLGS